MQGRGVRDRRVDGDRARRGAERRGLLLRVRDHEGGCGQAAGRRRKESTRHRALHQGWHRVEEDVDRLFLVEHGHDQRQQRIGRPPVALGGKLPLDRFQGRIAGRIAEAMTVGGGVM